MRKKSAGPDDVKAAASGLEPPPASANTSASQPALPQITHAENLNDRVARALAMKDGLTAASLAEELKECELNLKIMEVEGSQGAQANAEPAILAVRMERLHAYQRINASCQTVPGDPKQTRLHLLQLAVQQGVVGAAIERFEAGAREPFTLAHVVSDASSGDVRALATIAMYDMKVFSISRDEQDAARYALKLASTDPAVGVKVVNYLKIAESYAVPNSEFDLSKISSAARMDGVQIAGKIRDRLGKEAS